MNRNNSHEVIFKPEEVMERYPILENKLVEYRERMKSPNGDFKLLHYKFLILVRILGITKGLHVGSVAEQRKARILNLHNGVIEASHVENFLAEICGSEFDRESFDIAIRVIDDYITGKVSLNNESLAQQT